MKFLNYLISTGLGSGYSPVAPGTAGSLLAAAVIYLFAPVANGLLFVILVILFFTGVYTGGQLEKELGEDPSLVVIDEIVGMGISLLFAPPDWRWYLLAFLLFRALDILKPPPVRRLEKLHGGWGIMLDDVMAGVYALILVQLTGRLLL